MSKILDILLEITLSPETVKDIVQKGYIIAIKLKGEKNFIKNVKPLKAITKNKELYLSAEVQNPETGEVETKEYKVSDINNINRSSTKKEFIPIKPKEKEQPEEQPAEEPDEEPLAEPVKKPMSKTTDFIEDLINNNRAGLIYYQGIKEKKPAWRTILPVAYGSRTIKGVKHDYIRAWQWAAPSVRGVPKWKLFRTDRIVNWDLSSTQVIKTVPDTNYNPSGDKWMSTLYAKAIFEDMKPKRKKKFIKEIKSLISELLK